MTSRDLDVPERDASFEGLAPPDLLRRPSELVRRDLLAADTRAVGDVGASPDRRLAGYGAAEHAVYPVVEP